jgi:hypothetical protein
MSGQTLERNTAGNKMANFSLKQFQAQVRARGVAKPNRFEVEIPVPPLFARRGNLLDIRNVNLFCESTGLPGQVIGVKQQRIYGPAYQRPITTDFGGEGITMVFLIDQPMDIKAFFDTWLSIIIDPVTYNVHYQDDYAVNVTIKQLNEKDAVSYAVILQDCFPRSYNMLELNQGSTNSVHKLSVNFAYRKWIPAHRITNAIYPRESTTVGPPAPTTFQTNPFFGYGQN